MSPPTLPAELWREFLRLSVDIPGIFESKWDHPPDLHLWQGWELLLGNFSDYRSTLETKLSIVQVSRTWQEMGMELLYGRLVLFGTEDSLFRRMSLLASIFERRSSEHSCPGRAMKRLEISTSTLTPSNFPVLKRILTSCHNLRILIISPWFDGMYDPRKLPDLTSLLQSRFKHSLRRFELEINYYNQAGGPFPFQYYVQLPDIPLDTLELGLNPYSIGNCPTFTTVSTLTIHHASYLTLEGKVVPWHFPALRHLSLRDIEDAHIASYLPFLTSHGPQLFSLHVKSGRHALLQLPRLVTRAANLRSLVCHIWDIQSFAGRVSPSITHVGLHVAFTHLRDWSIPNSEVFPNLRCIRFLDISDNRPDLVVDIARKNPHIRVEDKERRLIL